MGLDLWAEPPSWLNLLRPFMPGASVTDAPGPVTIWTRSGIRHCGQVTRLTDAFVALETNGQGAWVTIALRDIEAVANR